MTVPLVSAIVPCYRQARYLPAALDSLFAQTHPRVEVIVVNDGSDDDTEAVATGYGDRVRYISQPNSGPAAARNTGVAAACGEWVQFLDADDLLHPDKLRPQLAAAAGAGGPEVVYSGYECFADGRPEDRWTYSTVELRRAGPFTSLALDWDKGLSIPIHGILFRRELFERLGAFDTSLTRHEDWDWHLRCAASGARFLYVPGRTALYRITGGNRSTPAANADAMRRGKYELLEKYLSWTGLSPSHWAAVRERYVTDRTADFLTAIGDGEYSRAAALLARRALGGGPTSARLLYAYSAFLARAGRQTAGKVARRVGRSLRAPFVALTGGQQR